MPVHTFHLARTGPVAAARALLRPPTSAAVPGLITVECMSMMELGLPILSPARVQLRDLAVFALWENDEAIDDFLARSGPLNQALATGWHVRLELLRRWGRVTGFEDSSLAGGEYDPHLPVVAVTLARLKLTQFPRFIRWGKPTERLVRDHPGTTLAVAGMRPARTLSTFSVWRTQQEMTDMVSGHSDVPDGERHALAMNERRRKDFHHEFTTLRFRSLGEYGEWDGQYPYVPVT